MKYTYFFFLIIFVEYSYSQTPSNIKMFSVDIEGKIAVGKKVSFNDVANFVAGKGKIYTEPSVYQTGETIKFVVYDDILNEKKYELEFYKNTQILERVIVKFTSISTDSWDAKQYLDGILHSGKDLFNNKHCGFYNKIKVYNDKSIGYEMEYLFYLGKKYLRIESRGGDGGVLHMGDGESKWYCDTMMIISLNEITYSVPDCPVTHNKEKIIESYYK